MATNTEAAIKALRDKVRQLCESYLPETANRNEILHWHQIGFDHIAKNYGEHSGTTCGFLPHWLLWRLGCRDATLVNRTSPDDGLMFRIGKNLSIFQSEWKKPIASWVPVNTADETMKLMSKKDGPQCGDFVIVRGGMWKDDGGERTRDSAHIFVLLDVLEATDRKVVWRVAQSGLSTDAFHQGGAIQTMTGKLIDDATDDGKKKHDGPNLIFKSNILNEETDFPRRVIGYTNLGAVGFGAVPDPAFTGLFDKRIKERATNDAGKVMQWLGWWELAPAGGFIPLGPTYLLLERGHEVSRLERVCAGTWACKAAGIWTRDGSKLEIEWDDGTPDQSWTITSTFVPRESTTGVANSSGVGPLTKLKKPPTVVPPRWVLS